MSVSNEVVSIAGKDYPIIGYQEVKDKSTDKIFSVPIADIPMMSDYKWQLDCLNDRLNHPEKYAPYEDVNRVIESLQKWLAEHSPK